MRWFAKVLLAIVVNAAVLLAAARFIPGVVLSEDPGTLLVLASIFTVLNLTIKPIVKFILGPLIILTFGIGLIAVNAFILYLLDIISQNLTMQSIPALIYAALLVSAVNLVFHLATRR